MGAGSEQRLDRSHGGKRQPHPKVEPRDCVTLPEPVVVVIDEAPAGRAKGAPIREREGQAVDYSVEAAGQKAEHSNDEREHRAHGGRGLYVEKEHFARLQANRRLERDERRSNQNNNERVLAIVRGSAAGRFGQRVVLEECLAVDCHGSRAA